MAKQIESTIPTHEQIADKSDLTKSHIPAGAVSAVNGVAYGRREIPTVQVVNGVAIPTGSVEVATTRKRR